MKTKAEEYFDNTGIPCDSYLTREIVINMLAGFATQQVNLLSKPAVSKCEDGEREALLLAFCKYADKKYWIDNEINKYEYAIKPFLESQQ